VFIFRVSKLKVISVCLYGEKDGIKKQRVGRMLSNSGKIFLTSLYEKKTG